jgi:hypothetical protein
VDIGARVQIDTPAFRDTNDVNGHGFAKLPADGGRE